MTPQDQLTIQQVIGALTQIGEMDVEMTNKDLTKILIKLAPVIIALEARLMMLESRIRDGRGQDNNN